MSKKNKQTKRTIKTLLLCKVNARGADQNEPVSKRIKNAYRGPKGNGRVLAVIGKVDAVSLYDTIRDDSNSNWLEQVYEDRKRIIHQSNEKLRYHPIHLISNTSYTEPSGYSCAVISLIYGVTRTMQNGFKSYETVIKEWFENKIGDSNNNLKGKVEVQVYNAVNICDAVVILYTKNLIKTLQLTNQLSEEGIARKTFSLVGISLPEEDKKESWSTIINRITDQKDSFTLRMQGSIRNQRKYAQYLASINKTLFHPDPEKPDENDPEKPDENDPEKPDENDPQKPDENDPQKPSENDSQERSNRFYKWTVFGQSDFSVQLMELDRAKFTRLVKLLVTEYRTMTEACWDAHTEFMIEGGNSNQGTNNHDPQNLLNGIFQKYISYSGRIDQEKQNKPKSDDKYLKPYVEFFQSYAEFFGWYDEFYELLSVHANIDNDPILHGPSYLIYRFVYILYDYLNKHLKELEDKKADKRKITGSDYLRIMEDSAQSIEKAIRGWGILTDQILKIDDLVFHGFENSSSLYNTLPECAVDFYHAFLLRIVEFIYKHDIYAKLKEKQISETTVETRLGEYCYDFLLLPEWSRTITIAQMFHTENVETKLDNPLLLSNPVKQVYLVSFPMQKIYFPFRFFTRLIHECFHNFGDTCRLRRVRKKHLCAFTTEFIISNYIPDENRDVIRQVVRDTIQPILRKHLDTVEEPTSDQSIQALIKGMEEIFSGSCLDKLRAYTKNHPDLYDRLQEIRANSDLTLRNLLYFFTEGYADLMMILLLNLSPKQYYNIFREDVELIVKNQMGRDAQRIALVSAVLCQSKRWKERKIKTGIVLYFKEEINSSEGNGKPDYKLSDYIYDYYKALTHDTHELSIEEKANNRLRSATYPIHIMKHAQNYLAEVEQKFRSFYEAEDQNRDKKAKGEDLQTIEDYKDEKALGAVPKLSELRRDFYNFFVQDNLFVDSFFECIYKDHDNVRILANNNEANDSCVNYVRYDDDDSKAKIVADAYHDV